MPRRWAVLPISSYRNGLPVKGSIGSGTAISDSFDGQCAVLFDGVETQGLDVSQQCNPLVDSRLRHAGVARDRHQEIGEQCRRLLQLDLGSQHFRSARTES